MASRFRSHRMKRWGDDVCIFGRLGFDRMKVNILERERRKLLRTCVLGVEEGQLH